MVGMSLTKDFVWMIQNHQVIYLVIPKIEYQVTYYTFKGKYTNFTHQSLFMSCRVRLHMWKKLYEALCGSRSSCAKSDVLPQAMSFESVSGDAEDYELEKNLGVWS